MTPISATGLRNMYTARATVFQRYASTLLLTLLIMSHAEAYF